MEHSTDVSREEALHIVEEIAASNGWISAEERQSTDPDMVKMVKKLESTRNNFASALGMYAIFFLVVLWKCLTNSGS